MKLKIHTHLINISSYKCLYCGKTFKTPNHHKCKFDPKMKGCFTCDYRTEEEMENYCNAMEIFCYEIRNDKRRDYAIDCDYWKLSKKIKEGK